MPSIVYQDADGFEKPNLTNTVSDINPISISTSCIFAAQKTTTYSNSFQAKHQSM